MVSLALYTLFIGATAIERVVEMVVSRRNLAWSLERGGIEVGFSHFPVMVVLHTAFLADFVVIYFRSLAASGLEGLLGGSDVQLGSLEASV